jgi:hypothetical protein
LASPDPTDVPPPLPDTALAAYVAAQAQATVAALHAQAVVVLNIKDLVPVILDNLLPHYNQWKTLFLNTLGMYQLSDHVLDDIPPEVAADPHWRCMDCTIRSWLYGTVASDLIEFASTVLPTTHSIWRGLEDQFIRNKKTRALILDVEFRTFVQGDLTISDCCRRLKGMVDALGDLGEAIFDRTLMLAALHGLNSKFSHMASLLKR